MNVNYIDCTPEQLKAILTDERLVLATREEIETLTADLAATRAELAKAIADRQDSDLKVMDAEKQRDMALRTAARADDGFGVVVKDWEAALATIDMLRGSNATLAADVAQTQRELAAERARLEKLYELADVSTDGQIVITFPLAKDSARDGVTAWWSEGHFTAAVDAARKEPV